MNPYDWKRNQPQIEVPRFDVISLATELREGGSAVLMAGRGMGKSVFLGQLQRQLESLDDTRVVLFNEPPAELSVAACLETLARQLGVSVSGALNAREIIDAYRAREDAAKHLVLLYDELDHYAAGTDPPGGSFFNSLEFSRRNVPRLGIMATGSIGIFTFRDVLGSSFLARADKVRIGPFDHTAIATLAAPFSQRGVALSSAAREALLLASGGNPALVTYALGALWEEDDPSEHTVAAAFVRFRTRNHEFLRDFVKGFADPTLSQAPQRAWDLVRSSDGSVDLDELQEVCKSSQGPLQLDTTDVLDLLEAAGLVRVSGSPHADPVLVRPVAGLLSLPLASTPEAGLRNRLTRDLGILLGRLHVSSADFFRPGSADRGKQIVPESVFAAFLALGLELLGWQSEREAQHVAGRTDLKLRWNGSPDVAIVEVKIWGRGSYRQTLSQLESYFSTDTVAGAVVMLTDAALSDWTEAYRRECLSCPGLKVTREDDPGSAYGLQWRSTTHRPEDAFRVEVDHFLLHLSRGRRP
jgi:hypothetical protein